MRLPRFKKKQSLTPRTDAEMAMTYTGSTRDYLKRFDEGPVQVGTKVHEALEAWTISPGSVLIWDPVPEVIIENPTPYRGAVAEKVAAKMIRDNVSNFIEVNRRGAKDQARVQLWSNFTNLCYAIGIPVDTNANLRLS